MDFLKNTKNGRIVPWSAALDKLPHMEPWEAPDVVAEVPEPPEAPEVEPDLVVRDIVVPSLEDMTRLELIEKAKADGLPVKANMRRDDVLALFSGTVEQAEG